MKTKSKLVMALCTFAFVMITLVTGVLAVTSLNFNIGGSIKFKAKGINATISAGTLSSTGSYVVPSDASSKMKQITLSTTTEDPNHSANVASWAGINLNFNENGDDVTISFTITNTNASTSTDKVYTKITANPGAGADNATIEVNKETAEIAPQATQNFVITFKVTNKNLNAELPSFVITVELALTAFQTTPASLSFDDYVTGVNTVAVSGFDKSVTSVAIPETVTKEGTTYNVTTIKASAFENCTVLEEITIPQTVTVIEPKAFVGCTNLTNIAFENTSNWHVSITADSTYGTAISVSDIANFTTKYCDLYIKSGTFTSALTLEIESELPTNEDYKFYIQFTSGMTWAELIAHDTFKYGTNSVNNLVGTIVEGKISPVYTDANFTRYGGYPSPIDGEAVSVSSVIDPNGQYVFAADMLSTPVALWKIG